MLFGLLTGRRAVEKSGGVHYDDSHKVSRLAKMFSFPRLIAGSQKFGLVLLLGFFLQAGLGALVHRKPHLKKFGGRLHACLGLMVIIMAFYQARTGYKHEWPYVTGRPAIEYLRKAWYILIVVSPYHFNFLPVSPANCDKRGRVGYPRTLWDGTNAVAEAARAGEDEFEGYRR